MLFCESNGTWRGWGVKEDTGWFAFGMFASVAVKYTLLVVNTPNLPIPINSRTEPANSVLEVYEHKEVE